MSAGLDGAREVEASVAEVTLLEDRARVVRRGVVELEPGTHRLLVVGVAPVLADKTLVARVVGSPAGVTVTDARPVRRRVFDPESVEVARAEEADDLRLQLIAELRELEKEGRRLAAERELAEAKADAQDRLAGWTLAELAEDVSLGRPLEQKTVDRLAGLSTEEREQRRAIVGVRRRRDEHDKRIARLRKRIRSLTNPGSRLWAGVIVDVEADRVVEVTLELEYVAPGALWRPAHTAELSPEDDVVRVATAACVWQNTGEDWNDVALCFSTERPSLGSEPPSLESDVLRVRKRQESLVVEAREQTVDVLAAGSSAAAVASELPGIDDGGATVSLRAAARSTVVSNGRPYRVPLSDFEVEARVELWAYPELSGQVIRKSVQTNAGDHPLLAGPVELIRERGWSGRTSVSFVAPGEEFELSWGPDADLRVRRHVDETDEDSRILSSWSSRERHIEVRLSNLGREARSLTVRERIPVSEIEKVKIEIDRKHSTAKVGPDDDGFLDWPVDLGPGERREIEYRYTFKKHDDVVGI